MLTAIPARSGDTITCEQSGINVMYLYIKHFLELRDFYGKGAVFRGEEFQFQPSPGSREMKSSLGRAATHALQPLNFHSPVSTSL